MKKGGPRTPLWEPLPYINTILDGTVGSQILPLVSKLSALEQDAALQVIINSYTLLPLIRMHSKIPSVHVSTCNL